MNSIRLKWIVTASAGKTRFLAGVAIKGQVVSVQKFGSFYFLYVFGQNRHT